MCISLQHLVNVQVMIKSLKKIVENKNCNSAYEGEVSLVNLNPQASEWNVKILYSKTKIELEIDLPFKNCSPALDHMNS